MRNFVKLFSALLTMLFFIVASDLFSQTVYVNQSGSTYHTNKCKLYAKSFEAVPLWKAKGPYGKKPCKKCNPPTVESKGASAKKKAKPKPAPAPAPKKK